jgi:hypothetical protein
MFFFFFPLTLFFKYLYDKNLRARFPFVQIPNHFFFDRYDSISKIYLTGLKIFPYILINLPFLIPMLLSGMFLYATNLFSITRIKRFWLFLWTGIRQNEIPGEIVDSYTLNACLYNTILLESFPQILIQTINNSKLNKWTDLAIISSVISGLSILDGIYRVVYYKLIKGINLVDVPIDISIVGVELMKLNHRSNVDHDLEQTVSNQIHGEIVIISNEHQGTHNSSTEVIEPLLKLQESVSKISQVMYSENKALKDEIISIKSENNDLKDEMRSMKLEFTALKQKLNIK